MKESLHDEYFEYYIQKHNITIQSCTICLTDFKPNDKVTGLRCDEKHCFHKNCILKWVENRMVCPLCRIDLDPDHLSEVSGVESDFSL